nr:hypothetical protein Iba_chr02bCG24290 [Ipomoea batatas]
MLSRSSSHFHLPTATCTVHPCLFSAFFKARIEFRGQELSIYQSLLVSFSSVFRAASCLFSYIPPYQQASSKHRTLQEVSMFKDFNELLEIWKALTCCIRDSENNSQDGIQTVRFVQTRSDQWMALKKRIKSGTNASSLAENVDGGGVLIRPCSGGDCRAVGRPSELSMALNFTGYRQWLGLFMACVLLKVFHCSTACTQFWDFARNDGLRTAAILEGVMTICLWCTQYAGLASEKVHCAPWDHWQWDDRRRANVLAIGSLPPADHEPGVLVWSGTIGGISGRPSSVLGRDPYRRNHCGVL